MKIHAVVTVAVISLTFLTGNVDAAQPYQCQTRDGQILTYSYGCPTGTVQTGGGANLRFSDSTLNALRNYGQSSQSSGQTQIQLPSRHVHSWSFTDRNDRNGVCNFVCSTGGELVSAPVNPNGFCSFPSS
jgi:hypothetical protein